VANLKGNVLGLRQCDEAIAAIAEAEKILDQLPPATSLTYQQVHIALSPFFYRCLLSSSLSLYRFAFLLFRCGSTDSLCRSS
jgi:hypothetical protein